MTMQAEVLTPEQEHDRAAELVDALEERVREGDESVSPEQIETARSLSRFARLRMDAAVRREGHDRRERERVALLRLRAEVEPLRSRYAALFDEGGAVARIAEILAEFKAEAQACDIAQADLCARLVAEAGVVRECAGHPAGAGPVRVDSLGRILIDDVPVLAQAYWGTSLGEALRVVVRSALAGVGVD